MPNAPTRHYWKCASCSVVIAGGSEPPGHFCKSFRDLGPRRKGFWLTARERVADLAGTPLESDERLERQRQERANGDAA